MRRSPGVLVGTILALAFGALLLAGCEGSDGGGNGDTGGAPADVAAGDSGGQGDGSGTEDAGATGDTGCVPSCGTRSCGDNGCGGVCGTCSGSFTCSAAGSCVCEPECGDRTCGPDPRCGLSCGDCALCTVCDDAGACVPGGDLSCPAYFVGLEWCEAGDNDCPAACRTAVVAGSGDLADTVAACFEASCAQCEDLECLRECGATGCGQDYLDCFAGTGSCNDVDTCADQCLRDTTYGTDAGDVCRADCLARGTVDAQTDYLALELCIREEGDCDPADMAAYEGCERRARNIQCSAQSADCPSD